MASGAAGLGKGLPWPRRQWWERKGRAGGQPLGRARKGDPCPWLMDPGQLLHNLDQVICGGLSLHPAAIVILQCKEGTVLRPRGIPPWQWEKPTSHCCHRRDNVLTRNTPYPVGTHRRARPSGAKLARGCLWRAFSPRRTISREQEPKLQNYGNFPACRILSLPPTSGLCQRS